MNKRKTPEGVKKEHKCVDGLIVMQIANAILAGIAAVSGIVGLLR